MPRTLRLLTLALLISLLGTGVVSARVMQQGERCNVPADTVIKGTLFVFCQHLTIAGRVDGNLIGIGLRTTISGEIANSVYLAGLELDISGTIQHDLHYIGLTLATTAPNSAQHVPIGGQVMFATLSAHLGPRAALPGPVTGLGYQILIDSAIAGEVNFWGSAFVLNGAIEGDVYAAVGNPASEASDLETLLLPLEIELDPLVPGFTVSGSGQIRGDLEYFGPAEGDISGTVIGEIAYHSTNLAINPVLPEQGLATLFADRFRREFAVLLTAGLICLSLARRQVHSALRPLRRRPVPSFVIGMLLFILSFPATLILGLITTVVLLVLMLLQSDGVLLVVGSLFTLFDIGIIGAFYFTAIFIARAVFALGLGRLILQYFVGLEESRRKPRLSLLIGVILLSLLTSLPVVGFVFNAGALFMGLGAISTVSLRWLHRFRNSQLPGTAAPPSAQSPPYGGSQPFPVAASPAGASPALPTPRSAGDQVLNDLPPGFDPDFFFSDD